MLLQDFLDGSLWKVRQHPEERGKIGIFDPEEELVEIVLEWMERGRGTLEVRDLLIQMAFPSDLPNFCPLLLVRRGTVIPCTAYDSEQMETERGWWFS